MPEEKAASKKRLLEKSNQVAQTIQGRVENEENKKKKRPKYERLGASTEGRKWSRSRQKAGKIGEQKTIHSGPVLEKKSGGPYNLARQGEGKRGK